MNAIVLDTETTGLVDPQPVEIAWARLDDPVNLTIAEQFLQRYQPNKLIELGALATHHIMDEELIGCPQHTEFSFPNGVDYLIGHNVDFDWGIIGKPNVKRIDTLCLSRKYWPVADSHSQSAMLYLLERATARGLLQNAHSAAADVRNCILLLRHILTKVGNVTTWEQLWEQSEAARIPSIMPFGKHKGIRIVDVPADYKRWLLGQSEVDPYLVKALRGET